MAQHPLRILSVDFDIFQTIPTTETFTAFPDGIDLPQSLSCITWSQHYADQHDNALLQQIGINEPLLQDTIQLIETGCQANTPTMIVNSHKHIYNWILQHVTDDIDSIDLTHLDMHHDMFNQNPELDCGNWISHVKSKYPNTSVQWICNPISKKMYGLQGDEFKKVTSDIQHLIGKEFDLLFICRSDNWLPPHLDTYFRDFCHDVLCTVETASVEPNIIEPRDISVLVEQTKALLKQVI